MNAERLLEVYEQISEAPDAIARLRRFVLDLAVRGKLVEQSAGDEPASRLLEQIGVEKERLAKIGEIKAPKQDKTKPILEATFELPPGWIWARLGDIAACLDFMRKPINGTEREKRIEGLSKDALYPYYGATQQQGWIDDYIFDDDLMLLGEDGVPFHHPLRTKAYTISGKTWVNNHAHVFKCILTSFEFLTHYLNVFDYSGRVVGATRAKLNQARALTIPVPLPPLAEQHRIVAKVDELMALCERLEEARKSREETRDTLTAASLARLTAPDTTAEDFYAHANFAVEALPALTTRPDQIKTLRQTILNLAVRGELVEQDPADEPAAELLRSINADLPKKKKSGLSTLAAPTQLANGWVVARLDEIAIFENGDRSSNYPSGPDIKPDGIAFFSTKNLSGHRLHFRNLDFITNEKFASLRSGKLQNQDILITLRGSVGKFGLFEATEAIKTGFINAQLMIIRSVEPALVPYLITFMQSGFFTEQVVRLSSGSATPQLSGSKLSEAEVWLPPLAEQRRIVAKIDALMALCDRLEAALTTTDTTRTRLLETLLREALEPSQNVMEAAE